MQPADFSSILICLRETLNGKGSASVSLRLRSNVALIFPFPFPFPLPISTCATATVWSASKPTLDSGLCPAQKFAVPMCVDDGSSRNAAGFHLHPSDCEVAKRQRATLLT